jgi:CDP-diacylglycerol--serine O-phosphatidyltransferase
MVKDLFTLANGVTGLIALYFISIDAITESAICLLFCYAFDLADGFLARYTHPTEFGGTLDSLSDAVSFGMVNSFFVFSIFFKNTDFAHLGLGISATILITALLRLARFNISKTQYYAGLPTTLTAVFFPLWFLSKISPPLIISSIIILLISLLMISEIPYPKKLGKFELSIVFGGLFLSLISFLFGHMGFCSVLIAPRILFLLITLIIIEGPVLALFKKRPGF